MTQDESHVSDNVRSMRIILATIVLFTIASDLFVAFIVLGGNGPVMAGRQNDLTMIILVALAATLLLAQFIIPGKVMQAAAKRLARQSDFEFDLNMMAAYRGSYIIALGLCEAAAMSVMLAYLLFGEPLILIFAGIAIFCMAIRFPTICGLTTWLERQREMRAEQLANAVN